MDEFDITLRGYNRQQVDEHMAELLQRIQDMSRRLEQAARDLEQARRERDRAMAERHAARRIDGPGADPFRVV
jgi:type II secretory pathway component PulJ